MAKVKCVVLDASLVLKWILDEKEEGVVEARKLHDQIIEGKIRGIAPDILLSEVVNVMFWKKKFKKDEILEFLNVLSDGRIGFVPMDRFEFAQLLGIMETLQVTIYDAYYLLLAKDNGCEVVSFDKKMLGS